MKKRFNFKREEISCQQAGCLELTKGEIPFIIKACWEKKKLSFPVNRIWMEKKKNKKKPFDHGMADVVRQASLSITQTSDLLGLSRIAAFPEPQKYFWERSGKNCWTALSWQEDYIGSNKPLFPAMVSKKKKKWISENKTQQAWKQMSDNSFATCDLIHFL